MFTIHLYLLICFKMEFIEEFCLKCLHHRSNLAHFCLIESKVFVRIGFFSNSLRIAFLANGSVHEDRRSVLFN